MAICNACRKQIDNDAIRCPYCTTIFEETYNQEFIREFKETLSQIISLVPLFLLVFVLVYVANLPSNHPVAIVILALGDLLNGLNGWGYSILMLSFVIMAIIYEVIKDKIK